MGVRGGRGGKGRVGGGGSDPEEEEGLILRKRAFSVRDRPSLADDEPLINRYRGVEYLSDLKPD